jgi:hypothetical protein
MTSSGALSMDLATILIETIDIIIIAKMATNPYNHRVDDLLPEDQIPEIVCGSIPYTSSSPICINASNWLANPT